MTVWMIATIALVPPLAVPLTLACRGTLANRLVAVQFAASLAVQLLVLMTFAFDQSAFMDLPLTLALLALPGTLAMALFLERWL